MTHDSGGDRILEARDVGVRYGRREILKGVSLGLGEGEVLALIGRNGEGKTSFVRCALGHQRPTDGEIELLGADVWTRRSELMREIGYVPERPQAPGWRTARELLSWGRAFYDRWEGDAALARLEDNAIPLDLPLDKLSQGQRKQVEIAFALASCPRLLILDDPAVGLDPMARRALWTRLVEDLADRPVSVLLTTHELEAVERVADRVALLHRGRILIDEPLAELRSRFRRLPAGTEARTSARELQAVGSVTTAWGDRRIVSDWPGDGEAGDIAARAEAMTLEEIFRVLMTENER
ncbi:MAG: ABC transporter ATP-binding protein [Thermoanaerobaculia bacterium]|nr:ABC transporter ATP-binding protein [Thermoanaerobaculia bacterium]